MFTTLGLFANVACPQGESCSLLRCLFSHEASSQLGNEKQPSAALHAPENGNERPVKRLKVSNEPNANPNNGIEKKGVSAVKPSSEPQTVPRPSPNRSEPNEKANTPTPKSASTADNPSTELPARNVPKESLNPRRIGKPPAKHNVRVVLVNKLHDAMVRLNDRVAKEIPSKKCFALSKQELIIMTLDEEEKVAKESPTVYNNVIKLRIVKFTKMVLEDWIQEVMNHLNTRYYKTDQVQQPTQKVTRSINAGLGLTPKDEIALATKLITPLKGLEEYGYVTKMPSKKDVETSKKGVEESKGWEKCDRCGARFQVFPGRHEDGSLATGGECTYHPVRPSYPPRKKTDKVTGSSDVYFSCCGEAVGASPGCTKAKTHVYKVSETKRLASVLEFKETPQQRDRGTLDPVSFDCEMGYTTLGLELIRLTAVSWPEGRELLDILVKPLGEILDLNSRYSGVFPEHYASSTPYKTLTQGENPSSQGDRDKSKSKTLQYVESPAVAREVLFTFLQPDTPLIGHAIDNDLNACRIIHPTIIDTVILYPHPRGRLPMRMGLKVLARHHLDRDIQTGGDKGHDSKEDAIATGDLVRVKAGEKWKSLKAKGWKLQDGNLVAPPS